MQVDKLGMQQRPVKVPSFFVTGVHAALQEEAEALKQRLGELEADHKAAIAAHSALEEHLDSQVGISNDT